MRNRKKAWVLILLVSFAFGAVFGIAVHRDKIFPYEQVKAAYEYFFMSADDDYGPWSIGIYQGPTPFDLNQRMDVSNPVITAKDVVDRDAVFVADPFLVIKDGKYTMFFEVLDRNTNQGDIGYAESSDGKTWEYRKIIIDESFHLSYPYVFEWEGEFFMIPESYQDVSVRLYRAISFPDKWEYVRSLMAGYRTVDSSIFRHDGKWWMFSSPWPGNDVLNIFYADDLLGEWMSHEMNPVVKFNPHAARPGGRVFSYQEKLFRIAQDDFPYYGMDVNVFEILTLSETEYEEREALDKPFLNVMRAEWNIAGMHHVDPHKLGDTWIAVVDGKSRNQ